MQGDGSKDGKGGRGSIAVTMGSEAMNGRDDVAQFLSADSAVTVGVIQRENPSQLV